jgi:membrane protease YdiL (CAAX protease family)
MAQRPVPEFLQVPWSVKDVVVLVAAWFGLQIVLALSLSVLARMVPAVAAFVHAADAGAVGPNFALDLVAAALGLGIVSLYLHKYGVGWSTAGWRRVSVVRAVLYLVGILAVFMLSIGVVLTLVALLVPGFNANQTQTNDFTGATSGSSHNLALIALVLLPPVLEETIFRGFIFPAIAKRTGVIWGAILSSALFGLAHWQANISIYTFVLGLLLCFMYVRLKSIVPGIFVHMLNNYLAFIALSGK